MEKYDYNHTINIKLSFSAECRIKNFKFTPKKFIFKSKTLYNFNSTETQC